MNHKKVSFGREAMDQLLIGLDTASDAVAGTIGPSGRNVYIQEPYGNKVINDGATIANKIILTDPEQDLGAWVIRNVTAKQLEDVGDGTTTTAILTQALIHAALERPENPMLIRTSLNESVGKVYEELKKLSTPITQDDVESVALVSCEDPALAKLIAEVTGKASTITVEDAKTLTTDYEIVDGYQCKEGFLSPHFADPKTGKALFTDVPIYVSDKKLSSLADIQPVFEYFKAQGITQCVFVVDDIDDSILGILVVNKTMGNFNSLVIKAHGDTLRDIAGATGATVISNATGGKFGASGATLGKARRVVADQHRTLFLGDSEASKAYADALELVAVNETNEYLKKAITERVAQLRGGVAVLRIAANTDLEREYLKLKAEDAVKAVQAALEEGVVPGAGVALYVISTTMSSSLGEAILRKALQAPYKKILENAGEEFVSPSTEFLSKPSIISDPTKVERLAVANAVSAAGTFITSFCTICEIPETK